MDSKCYCNCCRPAVPAPPGGVWYPDKPTAGSGGGCCPTPPPSDGGCSGGCDFPPIGYGAGFTLDDIVSMTFNGVDVDSALLNGIEVWENHSPVLSLSSLFVSLPQQDGPVFIDVMSNTSWEVFNR